MALFPIVTLEVTTKKAFAHRMNARENQIINCLQYIYIYIYATKNQNLNVTLQNIVWKNINFIIPYHISAKNNGIVHLKSLQVTMKNVIFPRHICTRNRQMCHSFPTY